MPDDEEKETISVAVKKQKIGVDRHLLRPQIDRPTALDVIESPFFADFNTDFNYNVPPTGLKGFRGHPGRFNSTTDKLMGLDIEIDSETDTET
ncbi:hypothetical protein DID80_07135 [Candidatus Marinamargulisbacteria bacterium SCGC AAA071-K20]|nr:hypothetical protein DID80_07135 [Candidatus Marinamargulisbacteria bacterium SCGC AAA071-K20]